MKKFFLLVSILLVVSFIPLTSGYYLFFDNMNNVTIGYNASFFNGDQTGLAQPNISLTNYYSPNQSIYFVNTTADYYIYTAGGFNETDMTCAVQMYVPVGTNTTADFGFAPSTSSLGGTSNQFMGIEGSSFLSDSNYYSFGDIFTPNILTAYPVQYDTWVRLAVHSDGINTQYYLNGTEIVGANTAGIDWTTAPSALGLIPGGGGNGPDFVFFDDYACWTGSYANEIAPPCVENWQCSNYVCNGLNTISVCNAATDLNSCGTSYTGNFTEFSNTTFSCGLKHYYNLDNSTLTASVYEDLADSMNISALGGSIVQGFLNDARTKTRLEPADYKDICNFTQTNQMTVSFWLNKTTTVNPTRYMSTAAIRETVTGTTTNFIYQGTTLALNATTLRLWQYITVTANGTDASLYVDGSLAGTAASTAIPNLKPGQDCLGASTSFNNYAMDEIKTYNVALTSGQVLTEYQSYIPACAPNWVAVYSPTICNNTGIKLLTYNDLNSCGSNTNLPGDNGTNVGCTPPVTPVYDFGNTTNLTQIYETGNTSSVPLIIETPSTTVTWVSPVNLSNTTIESIPVIIVVTSSTVSVDTAIAPASVNTPANIQLDVPTGTGLTTATACQDFLLYHSTGFYTVSSQVVANGQLMADSTNVGGDCNDASICTNVQCVGGVLTFQAQHFDSFGLSSIITGDNLTVTRAGINNTKLTIFAAFGLLAVLIIVTVAFTIIQLVKGGDADLIAISVIIIGGAVILFVGYIVISAVAVALIG